jgi:chromosome segregation ATPase
MDSYEKQQTENKSWETANTLLQTDLEASKSRVTQLERTLRERDATIRDLNDKLTLLESKWNKVDGVATIIDKYNTLKDDYRKLEDEKKNLVEKYRDIEEKLAQTQYTCDEVNTVTVLSGTYTQCLAMHTCLLAVY